jgi:hypothetical protein
LLISKVRELFAERFFFVGYKGGETYWLAIHSNQANLIVGGLRHRRHQQARQAPFAERLNLGEAVIESLKLSAHLNATKAAGWQEPVLWYESCARLLAQRSSACRFHRQARVSSAWHLLNHSSRKKFLAT